MEPSTNPYIKRAISRLKQPNSQLTPACKKLRKWLITTQTTAPQLAMMTGFNPSTIYAYTTGTPNTYPTLAQAFAIEWATKGEIQAWEWLDNPYIANRVRMGQLTGAKRFESGVKSFVLKYNTLKTIDGMLRHKARILSRMFGVEWGEVKKRCWTDGKKRAKLERADVSHLFETKNDETES